MFKIHEIREIIKLVDQSSIQEFTLELDGAKVSMKKAEEQPVGAAVPMVQSGIAAAPPAPAAPPIQVAAATVVESAPAAAAVHEQAKTAAAEDESAYHKIVSPMVGTFYRSPEPGAPAYVQAGDKVTASTVVCIVEAMKLFNEIEAEVTGEIVKVLVEDGQLVEYGQPLFLVKPE
ncbi:acetyl-CoA carboxylase biotin carboxyl carrier protein [Brevibacillus massiliensis]|uniref:acetyl-CoA carboxylase biotin carboxyl carrier protein n=1 Tax=Brevibacillus massiliensis TaxID=1118054 RepID=UPI0002FBB239|nr:acetyl-CoA carboxylase biotin carboxyl carrier protein [Brevibacillus massiliensis]